MILVRMTFQAAFGKADQVVQMFRESMSAGDMGQRGRILTDLSGPFHTVVIESEIESIDQYFRGMQEMFADQAQTEEWHKVSEMLESGTREFYTIESEF